MSDMHSFSVDVAKEVGVNAAILLQSIKWWCEKNKANGKHCYDGLYWTYNSVKAWQELYPYLGKSAIDSALKKLEERGFIKVGNYNKSAYDRTKWYAITDDGLRLFGDSISGNREMNEAESGNGFGENEEPIPVASQLPSTATNKKKEGKRAGYDEIIDSYTENGELRSALAEFVKMRKMMKKPLTNRALSLLLTSKKGLDGLASNDAEKIDIVQQSIMRGWQGFFPLKDIEAKKNTAPHETSSGFNRKIDADYYYQSSGDEELDKVLGLGKYAPKTR